MARLANAQPVIAETSSASGYKLTPSQLQAALTPRSRWLILNSPGNPTGAIYSSDELRAIAEVAAGHPRLMILCDDIYQDIVYDKRAHYPLPKVAPAIAERVLSCPFTVVDEGLRLIFWRRLRD
jgi:aspartate aminotransferase